MIDKEKIRALIERRRIAWLHGVSVEAKYKCEECKDILEFIDTLEVKEVDLDFTKEVDMWIEDNGDSNGFFNVQDLAKHFFELGLKAQKGE